MTPRYFDPTLEPERTMPPGKGAIASATFLDRLGGGFRRGQCRLRTAAHDQQIAAADRLPGQAGGRVAHELAVHDWNSPERRAPNAWRSGSRRRNSAAHRRDGRAAQLQCRQACRAGACENALRNASGHCFATRWDMVKRKTRTPGRPSGVSSVHLAIDAASQPHPITEVANPVIVRAACRAHRVLSAVMITAVARMPKASANVSSMRMPLWVSVRMARARTGPGVRWHGPAR